MNFTIISFLVLLSVCFLLQQAEAKGLGSLVRALGHRKNQRPSNKAKHQKGNSRRQADQNRKNNGPKKK